MAVRKVLIWPDPALKQVAAPIAEIDAGVVKLIDDLFETMYEANGVGLAATQIAVAQRALVIDLDPKGEAQDDSEIRDDLQSCGYKGPVELINPEIVEAEGSITWDEGCLSVPGITETVKRNERVKVKALNRKGQRQTFDASGLFAVALQHEIDHLDGRVFVEYLSKLKRDVIKRKMERLKLDSTDDGVVAAAM